MSDDRQSIDVHTFFGLTYANYLVLHRTILQSMPLTWQYRFTEIMRELDEAIGPDLQDLLPSNYDIRILARPPEWTYPICENCEGDGIITDAGMVDQDCPECDGSGRDYDGESRYETPEEVGFVEDPIPHYNRGRTELDLSTGLEIRFCSPCGQRHTHAQECNPNLIHTCTRCGFEMVGVRRRHEECDISAMNAGCWTTREVVLPS